MQGRKRFDVLQPKGAYSTDRNLWPAVIMIAALPLLLIFRTVMPTMVASWTAIIIAGVATYFAIGYFRRNEEPISPAVEVTQYGISLEVPGFYDMQIPFEDIAEVQLRDGVHLRDAVDDFGESIPTMRGQHVRIVLTRSFKTIGYHQAQSVRFAVGDNAAFASALNSERGTSS